MTVAILDRLTGDEIARETVTPPLGGYGWGIAVWRRLTSDYSRAVSAAIVASEK